MKICIASRGLGAWSETFVRKHIDLLPFDVVTLGGDGVRMTGDIDLFHRSLAHRIYGKIAHQLGWFEWSRWKAEQQARWLKNNGVEAVLAEFGPSGAQIMHACEMVNIPLVVHFHGSDAYTKDVIGPRRDEYLQMFGKAAAIIAVSHAMCRQLVDVLEAPSQKVHYVSSFVDASQFRLAKPHLSPPILLGVGRFVEKKAPHLAILAFAEALKLIPEAKLEMIGDGPYLPLCQQIVKALGLSESVIFHGVLTHDEVAEKMRNVRAYLQHSVTASSGDSEGTPVAILEAQCCGLPVISTLHAGIPDVVVHGESGYLSNEEDVQTMARNIVTALLLSPDEIESMSKAARARVINGYSREQTIDRLAGIIESSVLGHAAEAS